MKMNNVKLTKKVVGTTIGVYPQGAREPVNRPREIFEKISTRGKISKNDKQLLKLVKIAKEIVLKEDELFLKELAKH